MSNLATISLPANATPEQRITAVQCYARDSIIPALKMFKDTLDLRALRAYSCATKAALEGLAKLHNDKQLSKEARLAEYRAADYAADIATSMAKAQGPSSRSCVQAQLIGAGFPRSTAMSIARFSRLTAAERRAEEKKELPRSMIAASSTATGRGRRVAAVGSDYRAIMGGGAGGGLGLSGALCVLRGRPLPAFRKLTDRGEITKVRAALQEIKELAEDYLELLQDK
jgi:hypothetical protein